MKKIYIKRKIKDEIIAYSGSVTEIRASMRITVPRDGWYKVKLMAFHQQGATNNNIQTTVFLNTNEAILSIRSYANTVADMYVQYEQEQRVYLKENDVLSPYGQRFAVAAGGLYSGDPTLQLSITSDD